MQRFFLTPQQAADILNISLSTMKKLIYQGKIKTFKTPGGHHRILKNDIINGRKTRDMGALTVKGSFKFEASVLELIHAFSVIIESRQRFGHGHAAAVTEISIEIAKALDFSETRTERIARAALMHDVGMIGIAEGVINKDARLSHREFEIVKSHPVMGADILTEFMLFEDIAPIIEQHHERPDGLGYPYGLRGDNICIEAKVIALAESFDCMTSQNSYCKPVGFEMAVEEIKRSSGAQFDPAVVKAFLMCSKNIITETVGQ